jgi:hypothetical protein
MNRTLGLMLAATLISAAAAGAAEAQEVWGGVYAHDVKDGLSKGGFEGGAQLAAGVISPRLEQLSFLRRPSVHALVAVNTDGGTNYAAVGLSWRIGVADEGRIYIRPGLGVAVHDADIDFPSPFEPGLTDPQRQERFKRGQSEIDLGSRVLFEPEFAVGYQLNERVAVEASWLHISHGTLAGDQNPGISDYGVRLVYSLGAR